MESTLLVEFVLSLSHAWLDRRASRYTASEAPWAHGEKESCAKGASFFSSFAGSPKTGL